MSIKYINRSAYTDRIKPFIGKQIIKVLTGQRRIGKSYILYQLQDYILKEFPDANILYVNKEYEEYEFIKTHSALLKLAKERFAKTEQNFLFIDEVQEIDSFQIAIRTLFAENICDIYCTGSNATMLSGELATLLSGRYIEFNIHSLSYKEFLVFHELENSQDTLFKYLTYGGMPYLRNIGFEDNLPFEYLKNVYSTILLKDVVARENIRNISFLENLIHYLSDNVGNLFSALNISKFLKSQQIKMSPQLIINYLKALTNSYFVHKAVRSEIGGLKIFEIGEKYYFEDLGLRNSLIGFNRTNDIQKLLENAIYLYLIQNEYSVFVGKQGKQEIDFVANKGGKKIYIQASLTVALSPKTEKREFENLLSIEDNYPKYVITLNDTIIGNNYQGVIHMNLAEFLLGKL